MAERLWILNPVHNEEILRNAVKKDDIGRHARNLHLRTFSNRFSNQHGVVVAKSVMTRHRRSGLQVS